MPSPATDKRIALAAVAGAHGIRGEVKLKLFGEASTAWPAPELTSAGSR